MTITKNRSYTLSITTQGPTYPPSEIMDKDGNFIVIGNLNLENSEKNLYQKWGGAIVSAKSKLPDFGQNEPYEIVKFLDLNNLTESESNTVLYTLPLPLPCNNYPMIFSPEQTSAYKPPRPSYPFHLAPIPDSRVEDGRKLTSPIILKKWIEAKGGLNVTLSNDRKSAEFEFQFENLIPNSLYTIMALRENDLNPINPTRPGPLGLPNVFISDFDGSGKYHALMPNPFDSSNNPKKNRIVNVVVLWMSTQMSYGGAIGHYGLGGDIHAQLKLKSKSFLEFETIN